MRNKIKLRTIALAAIVYFYLLIFFGTIDPVISILFALYMIMCMLATYFLIGRERARGSDSAITFRQFFPLNRFGQSLGSFEYQFYCRDDLLADLKTAINEATKIRGLLPELKSVQISDHDPELVSTDQRLFWAATGKPNQRGSAISLVLYLTRKGSMQVLLWYILQSAYIDRNKLLNFVAYAPFLLPFWIVPYLRRRFNLIGKISTVYESFYNGLDLTSEARCVHATVFDTLVERLDLHGVDTSDLKLQRAQVMNISISGGQTTIGQVVQGAMNRVMSNLQPKARAA